MEVKCLVYTVNEVSIMLNVSISTAYRKIKEINHMAIRKGIHKECILSGKVSKNYFTKSIQIVIDKFN